MKLSYAAHIILGSLEIESVLTDCRNHCKAYFMSLNGVKLYAVFGYLAVEQTVQQVKLTQSLGMLGHRLGKCP